MTAPRETFDVPLLIDGKEVAAEHGRTMEVMNPATGRAIGTLAAASPGDVDRAVLAAQRAFDSGVWSHASIHHRDHAVRRRG